MEFADTLHFPKTVSSAFGALITTKVDALSIYPRQIMVTFAERMAVPIINIALQYFIPFILIKKSKSPLFSTAIGQFIFVSFFQAKYREGLSWKGRVYDVSEMIKQN